MAAAVNVDLEAVFFGDVFYYAAVLAVELGLGLQAVYENALLEVVLCCDRSQRSSVSVTFATIVCQ